MVQDLPEHLVEAGRGYERLFVPASFDVWTKHLVDGARVHEGLHVLDVACGTGVLSRSALNRTGANGRDVGVDPAPGMLAAANEIEPSIEWLWVESATQCNHTSITFFYSYPAICGDCPPSGTGYRGR
jgi:SAM-dependent methyltransferase